MLDRIDMHIHVPRLRDRDRAQLLADRAKTGDCSEAIRARVTAARRMQLKRAGKVNARLSQAELRRDCMLDKADENTLAQVMDQLKLSPRAFFRILKMSRTIADLEGADNIARKHLLEAIGLRFPRNG